MSRKSLRVTRDDDIWMEVISTRRNKKKHTSFSRFDGSYRRSWFFPSETKERDQWFSGQALTNRLIAPRQNNASLRRRTLDRSASRRRDQNSLYPRNGSLINEDVCINDRSRDVRTAQGTRNHYSPLPVFGVIDVPHRCTCTSDLDTFNNLSELDITTSPEF